MSYNFAMSWWNEKRTEVIFTAADNRDYSPTDILDKGSQTSTETLLLDWAQHLPGSSRGILDLAAGQGYESAFLYSKGYKVEAYDRSPYMSSSAVYPVKSSSIEKLHLSRNSYSGALLKDAWVFLSASVRMKMLNTLYVSLVKGGSVLVISQIAETVAHIMPGDSHFPIKVYANHYHNESEWNSKVADEVRRGGSVISIEFESNESEIQRAAAKTGFRCTTTRHSNSSPIARENRWIQQQSFVAQLTK